MAPKIGSDYFERLEKLYTGLIADVLDDQLGFKDNVYIMDYGIRPLYFGALVAGRAATALAVPVYREPEKPYQGELEFIDSLEAGDVAVATQSGAMNAGLWGALVSTGARYRGGRGAVVDGITRDTKAIVEMEFPVFVRGIAPGDSKGRVEIVDRDCQITCGGVWVRSGDVIFGDNDGVVVIPQDIAQDVLGLAEEKYKKESKFEEGLKKGATAREMFEKYRVL